MRFSASSKTECHGKENKNRGHRQRSRNQLVSAGRYKHSTGSEKYGRKRTFSTSERRITDGDYIACFPSQRGTGTQAQEWQAGKQDYDTVFMCGSNVTARLGKQVYIRKEYHDRIQKMLHVIGGNEVTIAAFLDNVLTHHFTLFQDEIAESFKRHMESYNL
ncbi:MAG: DUF3408 domain-containing protein [Bacteroidales bacterium]|nr:MAG: DUF3408 domain-containing protein [Bacteroidales bacterium]